MPSLNDGGMSSRDSIALNILQIQFLNSGPLWVRWRGDSWSCPPELSFFR